MQGAEEMIEAGALENVARIVSLHVDPETPVGRAAFRCGPLTAASEELQVTVRGVGGHAARPHHSDDPIAVATQFINTIYQFIPRAVDSRDPVVVTFGMIRGGENANVIPEIVNLRGIMRTIRSDTAEQVRKRIIDIAHGIAEASRATIDVHFRPGAAAVVNDDSVTDICISAAKTLLGPDHIDNILLPSMGAEDFSAYSTVVPGCMFRLGAASGDKTHFLHSPSFDIDEKTLAIGAKLLAHCAVMLAKDPNL
jgi:amidohydrolase